MVQDALYFLLSLLFLSFSPFVQAAQCTLCASADQGIVTGRWGHTFPDQMTCQQAYLETIPLQGTDYDCWKLKDKYRDGCCNPNADVTTTSSSGTPTLPEYDGQIGTEPTCPVCSATNEYPGRPNQLIVARYVGEYTCGQLFERGFHGMVPAYMCGPLQDFTYYSCGCGVFNPVCATDPSKCFGGANYEAPYIIPFDTTIVTQEAQVSSSSATTRQNPGTRNLRRGVHSELLDAIEGDDPSSSTASISAQNFHFETRETSEEDVSS